MAHTQDVFMSQQHSVVDLSLSEPGLLIPGGEDFDCNILSLPLTSPHFTITALTWWTKRWERCLFAVGVKNLTCVWSVTLLFNLLSPEVKHGTHEICLQAHCDIPRPFVPDSNISFFDWAWIRLFSF